MHGVLKMPKKRKTEKKEKEKKPETQVPEKYRMDRNMLDARKKTIDSGLESAIKLFKELPEASPEERRISGRMLRDMRQDFLASFRDLRQHMPLTISEIRFVEKALRILKNNYSREGLEEILRLTCTLSGKPHPVYERKKAEKKE